MVRYGDATPFIILGLYLSPVADARIRRTPGVRKLPYQYEGPIVDKSGAELPPLDTTYYFDQLIDHNNPSLGTFEQRYWHTWQFYESGGPIVLTTPGEQNADGFETFLTNATIVGQIAEQQNGATIVLEHRYYGESNPFNDLSVASLEYHTIQQAIDDLVYFAQNVKLPMPGGDQVTPDQAPWILVGGSYAGALTSFTVVNKPGVFYAAWSSSGVVESIVNYWGYYDVIRQHMPQNCSADIQNVIKYIDEVLLSNDAVAIDFVKNTFNLNLAHLDDLAAALQYPVAEWQELQPAPELTDLTFFGFCDALEVQDGASAPEGGWGVNHALPAWGSWWQNEYYPSSCGDLSAEDCFGTYDASSSRYTDIAVDNAERSWYWIVCNEMGFFQGGAPKDTPSIVSRLVQPIWYERQCVNYFPEAFSSPPTPQVNVTNQDYNGWFVQADRLFFANGERDPWRDASMSADGTNFASTSQQPISVGDGFHCSDMYAVNAEADSTIAAVQSAGLEAMKGWLADWQAPTR